MVLTIFLIDGLYSLIWYIDNFVYEITSIYYIYPGVMTEVNVSATVGMSATVWGGMCAIATVGECPQQLGKCPQQWGN